MDLPLKRTTADICGQGIIMELYGNILNAEGMEESGIEECFAVSVSMHQIC